MWRAGRSLLIWAFVILIAATSVVAQQPLPAQPPVGPQAGPVDPRMPQGAPLAPQQPLLPFPPLTPQEQAGVDQLLFAWEQRSGQIVTFSCDFTLFDYDANWTVPAADPNKTPRRQVDGQIKFAKPDKGAYIELPKEKEDSGECWICDGKAVFTKDFADKRIVEHRLPAEMQGKLITESPLPFVFGVEARKLKERYWVRIITPSNARNQVWVEAYPKRAADLANYRKVEVILDANDLLPSAVQVFAPTDDSPRKRVAKVYAFRNIKRNGVIDRLNEFMNAFVSPSTPLGWTRVVEEPPTAAAQAPQQLQPPNYPTAAPIANKATPQLGAPQPGVPQPAGPGAVQRR
ncbi:MAG: TIGR03009 domain-containing protein [Planctomycetes bacterium]|nr:TIGR03009 domain-containing protein [Planctomycetota bacterium]